MEKPQADELPRATNSVAIGGTADMTENSSSASI
jgi:hypothetical protein